MCKIFLNEFATDQVLEATARAITYYLDVSQECTPRIVACEGTLRAICNRLLLIELDNRVSIDLAEQCIKLLELICARESHAVYESGGLTCILPFILDHGQVIHKDTLHSAMSVVTRLCGKMEPPLPIQISDEQQQQSQLDFCVETLSKLLKHEDSFVADGALRCFASLSDRFTRKNVDPAPLAKHGLIDELIKKLGDSILSAQTSSNNLNSSTLLLSNNNALSNNLKSLNSSNLLQNSIDLSKSTSGAGGGGGTTVVSISTLTSLLSTLCRSSDLIFREIVKSSQILDSLEKAMILGDERCVLDTIRFVDLLLTLIYEGREALNIKQPVNQKNLHINPPQSSSGTTSTAGLKVKKYDPAVEKLHRQLIEWVRIKDTESFIEALEASSPIDINFMDDVGQTLLNWCSAFGTAEMCEFLCSRGADVNKGLRSSSLHYASCFGRAQIVKILLRYGANPDLRDEEGKTALDKARERNEESHRDVVQILQQSPHDFTTSPETSLIKEEEVEKEDLKDDLFEVKLLYARRLLPIFSRIFLNSMIQSISKSCLNMLRKLIAYSTRDQLSQIFNQEDEQEEENEDENEDNKLSMSISHLLVEVIAKILQENSHNFSVTDNCENSSSNSSSSEFENQNLEYLFTGLSISNDLFVKCSTFMIEEFTRFGVSNLISQIAQANIDLSSKIIFIFSFLNDLNVRKRILERLKILSFQGKSQKSLLFILFIQNKLLFIPV